MVDVKQSVRCVYLSVCPNNNFWTKRCFILIPSSKQIKFQGQGYRSKITVTEGNINIAKMVGVTSSDGRKLLTEDAESVVEGDDDDIPVWCHDTSVVRISGSRVERLAVNKHDNRK